MKNKILLVISTVICLLLLTILITNVIYNMSEKFFDYSYACCDDKNGTIYYEEPCKCKSNKNILEKTLIFLEIKEN